LSAEIERDQRRWMAHQRLVLAVRELRTEQRGEAMRRFVELAWREFESEGVSWLGFYVDHPDAPSEHRLVLECCAPKPACSPIGLHGACGQALTSAKPLVVRDVAELGANYIACDPRDRSEVVVPCLDGTGRAWGVLDLDSHEVGAFGNGDASMLQVSLLGAGLSAR